MMMKKIVAAVCLIVFGMQSCEKAEISKNESEMRFSASYDLEPLTKAPIPFPSGNKSTIIGYTAGANLTSATPVAGTPLEATGAGTGVTTSSHSQLTAPHRQELLLHPEYQVSS